MEDKITLEDIVGLLNDYELTDEELQLIHDVCFYIITEDFDLICHCLRKYLNFQFGSLPCINKTRF